MKGSRQSDTRFLLPEVPRTVTVLGDVGGWAGLPSPSGGSRPDLVVCSADALTQSLATDATSVVAHGRGAARVLRAAGYRTTRWLGAPDANDPEVLLPIEQRRPVRHALDFLLPPTTGAYALRNAAFGAFAGRLPLPPLPAEIAIGTRLTGQPAVVRAALAALSGDTLPGGAPPRIDGWLAVPGQGDSLSRGAVLLWQSGEQAPSLVVKLARTAGRREPFDNDERSWQRLQAAGPVAAQHVPALLARFELAGHPGSVEEAAQGERLGRRLIRGTPAKARVTLDAVVAWVTELGAATRSPAPALTAELAAGARALGSAADLTAVPGVLAHHDLGTWNVFVGDGDFHVLDWESSVAPGPPLWDLLYLLSDGLALLDGARTHSERAAHVVACAAGRLPSSPVLYRAVRAHGVRLGLPLAALGPLAALCWEHHAGSRVRRGGGEADVPAAERVAALWRAEPALGVDWPALGLL